LGDTGCFSFYPTKVLGCYGDGGMLTTNSDAIDARVRRLRNHGASAPFLHAEVGYNSRLDEIQAALLRLKLRSVDKDINSRRDVAQRYSSLLKGTSVRIPVVPDKDRHVFNLYTVRVPRRDEVRDFLTAQRIGSSVCYPQGLHRQQVYAHLGYKRGSLPVCEQATEETLSLPIYPDMPAGHIMRVCETLKQLVSQ
jgi:dTDP-4-amino-4,6-dideoxygalactose transaminase